MKATIRQQVKENFQNMEFSKAMEVNNELKSEYIRVCGQRSWVSLVNYYSKKATKEQPEVEQQPEETVVEQPEVQEPVAEVKELSPIMKQFHDLKEQHPDAVLLFRVGDFYETYGEDAETAAEILGIVLTTRNTDGTKMAGFPHHALDTYLPKLVRAGKRIAICDQLEDPKLAKKVKRGITELVTPGMAEEKQAETPIEEEASQEPTTEAITSEEVGTIEDIITPTEEPAKEETYKFTVSESFNLDAIRQLVESGQPILNQFCIIHEFFKRVSDTETVRYTRMFVKADGEGWKLYDEGSAVAKKNELKSYRKLGYFDQSNDGFPVGEEYSQITVMRIKKALEKFVLGRSGATQVTSVMTVAI